MADIHENSRYLITHHVSDCEVKPFWSITKIEPDGSESLVNVSFTDTNDELIELVRTVITQG